MEDEKDKRIVRFDAPFDFCYVLPSLCDICFDDGACSFVHFGLFVVSIRVGYLLRDLVTASHPRSCFGQSPSSTFRLRDPILFRDRDGSRPRAAQGKSNVSRNKTSQA
jgi:hypothetical protein